MSINALRFTMRVGDTINRVEKVQPIAFWSAQSGRWLYSDRYFISESGFVVSNQSKKKVLLAQHLHESGYLRVVFSMAGIRKVAYVHRLVAFNFIHNPKHYPKVVHLDGNKLNNHVSNLVWSL